MTTAAQRLVQNLIAQGVTHVFCVPGESYLAVLDALWEAPQIKVVTCRQEAGAANMAVAHGKLTGRPGVCMVTRGPGVTHASIGVHTAKQDSVPMVLFVGQVAREQIGREAFQEVDYPSVFGTLAKWTVQIDDANRMDEVVGRVFATAVQGRAGPVVVALPEDMLRDEVSATAAPLVSSPARAGLPPETLAAITRKLEAAKKPLLILGGTGWTADAAAALADWAGAAGIPIALSFRRKDIIDNTHLAYAGDLGLGPNPKLVARVREADLVIAIGARMGENPTQGYTLLTPEDTASKLVHIHPDPNELGRVWPAALAACADASLAAEALSGIGLPHGCWREWGDQAHADWRAFIQPVAVKGKVNLSEVFTHLADILPADAIVCNGAGNYAAWLHRFFVHRGLGTQIAPTSGAMGFGFPAAVGVKIVHPEREVIAVAGDGCFMMNPQELATAAAEGANLVTIVVDNAAYGTIRMHQQRDYPGRVIATDLANPDFVAFAKSFGCWSKRVERTEDFPAALAEARTCNKPALIHLITDLDDILPGKSLV